MITQYIRIAETERLYIVNVELACKRCLENKSQKMTSIHIVTTMTSKLITEDPVSSPRTVWVGSNLLMNSQMDPTGHGRKC